MNSLALFVECMTLTVLCFVVLGGICAGFDAIIRECKRHRPGTAITGQREASSLDQALLEMHRIAEQAWRDLDRKEETS